MTLITDFLEYLELERNASQLTIKNYDHYLKQFLEFAHSTSSGRAGDIKPSSIDLDLIRKYKEYLSRKRYKLYLSKKPLKVVTQNFFLIALRSFLNYLKEANIQTLPAEEVKLKKQEARPIKPLNFEDLGKLLNAPNISKITGLRDRAILETLFSTGLKVSELVTLNRADFTSFWVAKYLSVRKDDFKPLFIRFQGKVTSENSGEKMRLTPRSIERIVEKYAKKLGLSPKPTPHSFRYNFISSRVSPNL